MCRWHAVVRWGRGGGSSDPLDPPGHGPGETPPRKSMLHTGKVRFGHQGEGYVTRGRVHSHGVLLSLFVV